MKRFLYIIIISLALASCEKAVSEFQSKNYMKLFGSGTNSRGYDIAQLPNGYIMVGYDNTVQFNRQVYAIRINSAGNTIWERRYGSTLQDEGRRVKYLNENIYIAGVNTNELTGQRNSFVLSVNEQGDSLSQIGIDSVVVNDLLVSEDHFIVAGESYRRTPTSSDAFVGKYTHSGEVVWQQTFGSLEGNQSIKRIFNANAGGFTIVGTNSHFVGSTYSHITVGSLNSQGSPTEVINLPAESNHTFGDAIKHNNEILIAYTQAAGEDPQATVLSLSTAKFARLWELSDLPCQARAISVSPNGIITLCGEWRNTIHLYQLDEQGGITLNAQDVKTPVGFVERMIVTSDRGLALIGATGPDYGTMMQVIKTDTELFLFNKDE